MNFPAVSVKDAGQELNRLHGEIERSLRSTVEYAIRAGEILTQVKERVGHGEFLTWLNNSVSFSRQTADNYRRLYEHRNKMLSVSNLQEAYKVVEQIETVERQTEQQKARQRVAEYQKTGVKPEGWRRGTDDKLVEEERDRDERVERAKANMAAAAERKQDERAQREDVTDFLAKAAEEAIAQSEQRQEFKRRIRVSQSGESDQFIEALMDYLDELDSDTRRIEACQNIIKVCRNIAADLQRSEV